MNIDTIYSNLKSNYCDFLPHRFRLAINELTLKNNLRICESDKGGKVIILDEVDYLNKMYTLLNDVNTYIILLNLIL